MNRTESVGGTIGKAILATVALAGVMSVALVAPGVLQGLAGLRSMRGRKRPVFPSDIRLAVKRLERRGLVKISVYQGDLSLRLTAKGEAQLTKLKLQEVKHKKATWDGKWRMIIFDIEERRRKARDRVRRDLQSFGLVKLQESVWVYPYDCEEVVTLLKAEYRVSKDVLYVVAGEIEGDAWLRKQFHLV